MDASWLNKLYENAGLEPDQADRAAKETMLRLLRRERPTPTGSGARRSLTEFFSRDPMVSVSRIVGKGDAELPFYDEDTRKLSPIAFGNLFSEIGLDPVVAMAYARVVVEAFDVSDLYEPIWRALGQSGPLDIEHLRKLDWTALRSGGARPTPARRPAPAPSLPPAKPGAAAAPNPPPSSGAGIGMSRPPAGKDPGPATVVARTVLPQSASRVAAKPPAARPAAAPTVVNAAPSGSGGATTVTPALRRGPRPKPRKGPGPPEAADEKPKKR